MEIERHLLELEGVLKYGDGSNYLLKELIGSDRMIKLWNEYPNQVCDRQCNLKYYSLREKPTEFQLDIFQTLPIKMKS
jgi:hypothetical protein